MTRLLALALLAAGPAAAQTMPEGCFARDYDMAHLAANPDQNVASIRLGFHPDHPWSQDALSVAITLADQGRARAEGLGGQTLTQFATCWIDGGTPMCGVDCDAGLMEIVGLQGDTLTVRTSHFWVGDVEGCGGAFDLAEGDPVRVATTYRLTRAPATACPPLPD